jgi:hypothetical protein
MWLGISKKAGMGLYGHIIQEIKVRANDLESFEVVHQSTPSALKYKHSSISVMHV